MSPAAGARKPLVASMAECNEIKRICQATSSPRPHMMDMQLYVCVCGRASAAGSAAMVITQKNLQAQLLAWSVLEGLLRQ
jgi:hypothetical protein